MYVVYMSACDLYVRTVLVPLVHCFDMDSLGDAPIVRRPACLGVHAVRVLQWAVCAVNVVYTSACACRYALSLCNVWHGQLGR